MESDEMHLHISESQLYIYRVVTFYTYEVTPLNKNRRIWGANEQDPMYLHEVAFYLPINMKLR